MPRKSKKLYHTDGELNDERPQAIQLENANLTIDEILGKQVLGQYAYRTPDAYENALKEMTDADLQKECVDKGIFPKDNRVWNINKLLEQFNQFIVKAQVAHMKPVQLNRKLTKAQREVLANGANKVV